MAIPESRISDFLLLLKPRVMSLVVFTGWVGLYLAPGEIHPFLALVATFCIALGSGAAGAVNMWYERDVDSLMERTKKRPLPDGRMSASAAIEFAVLMAFISVFIMVFAINVMAAFLLLCAILFYVFIYTVWLKRRTPQNIVIGGAAGAFPPMIGWASVTGSISLEPVILFLIIFLWTPPHFWALSLYRNADYSKAGIPMLPVVAGGDKTRAHIFYYSVALVACSYLPVWLGAFGLIYALVATLLGVIFLHLAYRLKQDYQEPLARKLFGFSIIYLFVLFLVMVVDRWFVGLVGAGS